MLRSALTPSRQLLLARPSCQISRTFVSAVLLSNDYASRTTAALKEEAKKRGLSQKGNKATLVQRISQDDQRRSLTNPESSSPVGARSASTTSYTPVNSPSLPHNLNIKIPDLSSQGVDESPVAIPFIHDLWGASHSHDAHITPPETAPTPVMVTIASPDTHAAPPSHNLYQPAEHRGAHASESAEQSPASFWRELGNDLGLPSSWGTPRTLAEAEEAVLSAALATTASVSRPDIELEKRKLTSEERERERIFVFNVRAGCL
ncbi:hypothetical protein SISSUDRAFT_1041972 [Sistotremastrum suecicum HHB10207 ss-3]|uniref:SAP domain-containing protein n=1 Tax=Sistotremastrum suecicum HHB10207 ss-3 TaxID=1314776 RepID=A0A166GV93_9AGAM|nr:hypothetical protein SISSUDRAFT_1041972 [Sistotremastrum suecicum HHB10207 ss-3]